MLENIKCSYILKIVFSLLQDKTKLKLIKYNKFLQKEIDINITYYRIFNGKYTIFEKEGIGKSYDSYNHQLIYEGEFLNGEKNGKGREYDTYKNLIFEGEFKNGIKWNGILKEYSNGSLIFEGE